MNEGRYYYFCKSNEDDKAVIQLYKSVEKMDAESAMELITSIKVDKKKISKDLKLKINADGKYYSFLYAFGNDDWISLNDNLDAVYLRAVIPRNFVGAVFAMYATSLGEKSNSVAYFDWFEYSGNDEVICPPKTVHIVKPLS